MDKILTLFAATETADTAIKCAQAGGEWENVGGAYRCTVSTYEVDNVFGEGGIVTGIINTILYIVGIAAVVMIIVGGIRYATSAGNEKSVTGAKNTIIYALIGLAAAMLAWVIVNFVITQFA